MQLKMNDANKEIDRLARQMRQLSPEIQDELFGAMTTAAAKVFVKHARSSPRFRDRTGRLRKSIRASKFDAYTEDGRRVKDGAAIATIGGRGAVQGYLIEFGTDDRTQDTTGRFTGKVEARRPMTTAFDTQQKAAADAGTAAAVKNFNKMVDNARRKGGR